MQDQSARMIDATLGADRIDPTPVVPSMAVLDALFAQIQLEQKSLTRRYMAVTELRGVVARLARDGMPPKLDFDGDTLVLSLLVTGLGAFVDVLADEPAMPAAAATGKQVLTVAPVVAAPAPCATAQAVAAAVQASAVQPVAPEAKGVIDAESHQHQRDLQIARAFADHRRSGMNKASAMRAVSAEFNVSLRGLESALQRRLGALVAADLQANPIPAEINAAASLACRRGTHVRPGAWTGGDDTRLLELVVQKIRDGIGKMKAIQMVAREMGRSPKACEARLYNVLTPRFERMLGDHAVVRVDPRKVPAGKLNGWTAEESARLVQLVADGICAGMFKRDAIAAAAVEIGRPFSGAEFRVLNKAKADLEKELARRAGLAAIAAPAVASPEPSVAAVPPAAVQAGDGVAPPPSGPVAQPVAQTPAKPATAAASTVAQTQKAVSEPVVAKPVAPVVKQSLPPARPVLAPAPKAAAPSPAPVVRSGPRPDGRETQVGAPVDLKDITAHLKALTKGDAKALQTDFALIHLACAGWSMPEIAADLGMDSKAVKQRFEALCDYDPATKKGRFPRSYVYHGIEALLKLRAVA